MSSSPIFLTRKAAADLMGLSPKTLSNWGQRGRGPRAYNPTGGRALYDQNEVIAFIRGEAPAPQAAPQKPRRGRPPRQPLRVS